MQSHIHVTTTHSKSTNNPAVAQNGNALPGALNPSPPDRTPQVRFAERPPLKVASSNRNDPWMARYDSAFQTHVPLLATATERGQRSGSASERVHRRIRCFIIVRIVVYAVGTPGPRVGWPALRGIRTLHFCRCNRLVTGYYLYKDAGNISYEEL